MSGKSGVYSGKESNSLNKIANPEYIPEMSGKSGVYSGNNREIYV